MQKPQQIKTYLLHQRNKLTKKKHNQRNTFFIKNQKFCNLLCSIAVVIRIAFLLRVQMIPIENLSK
jgi:hypothetical protein